MYECDKAKKYARYNTVLPVCHVILSPVVVFANYSQAATVNLMTAAVAYCGTCLPRVISRHFTLDHPTDGYAMRSSRSFRFLATVSERPEANLSTIKRTPRKARCLGIVICDY